MDSRAKTANITRRGFLASALLAPLAPRALAESCPGFDLRFGVAQSGAVDPLASVDLLARCGFDYCEPSLVSIMSLGDSDFAAVRARMAAAPIGVESMNVFLPPARKVVGPSIDRPALDRYIAAAFARAESLGAKVIVFGSAGARRVPEGFPRDAAWRQLRDFLRRLGDEIDRRNYGFVIGIEALRRQESNIVNTTAEAYQLSVDADHPKIGIICDFFHLAFEREDPRDLLKVKDKLVHLHFSNPTPDRPYPRDPSECAGYAPFFANLRAIGYKGRLSVEANSTNLQADAPAALATLRKLYASACPTLF